MDHLKEARLPKISEEKLKTLEKPITEEKINIALRETAMGKSPGPDGFTTLYFKKCKEVLISIICLYINRLGIKFEMRRETLLASITVILKGKMQPYAQVIDP